MVCVRWTLGVVATAAFVVAGCSSSEEEGQAAEASLTTPPTKFLALPASGSVVYAFDDGQVNNSLTLTVARPTDAPRERSISTWLGPQPINFRVKEFGASRDVDSFVSPFDGVLSLMPRTGTAIANGASWGSTLSPALMARFSGATSGAFPIRIMNIIGTSNLPSALIVRAEIEQRLTVVQRGKVAKEPANVFGVVDFVVTGTSTLPARVLYLKPKPGVTATTLAMAAIQPHTYELYCLRSAASVPAAALTTKPSLSRELAELAGCYAGVTP